MIQAMAAPTIASQIGLTTSSSQGSAGRARALRKLGTAQMTLGDYQESLNAWAAALPLFEQAGDRRAAAETLSHIGALQIETGDIAAAFASQSAARNAFRELDNPVGEANALCYMGDIQRPQGNFDESIGNLTEAIALYGDDSWSVAGARYFLGHTLRAAGRLTAAGVELAAAQAAYQASRDEFDEAGVLNQIGLLHIVLGQHAEAAAALDRALRLYDHVGSPTGVLEVLNSLGELALATGNGTGAESSHRKALDIAVEKKVPREEARAREGIGRALRQAGRSAEAAECFRAAHTLYAKLESPCAVRLQEEGPV